MTVSVGAALQDLGRAVQQPSGDCAVVGALDDMEGGLVSVDLPDGGQSILRQDRQLFNNPLGVAVISNRAPAPALSASPARNRARAAATSAGSAPGWSPLPRRAPQGRSTPPISRAP